MLCVIAKLDPDATEKLRALQSAVSDGKRAPLYGHITAAVYVPDGDAAFMADCRALLRNIGPFSVLYDRVEVLTETSVIVAAPRKNDALLSLHDRIAARYGPFMDQWTRGDGWYPHTTLLYDPQADLPRLCRALQKFFSPFEARVESIEFSRVTENGYEIVGRMGLQALPTGPSR